MKRCVRQSHVFGITLRLYIQSIVEELAKYLFKRSCYIWKVLELCAFREFGTFDKWQIQNCDGKFSATRRIFFVYGCGQAM